MKRKLSLILIVFVAFNLFGQDSIPIDSTALLENSDTPISRNIYNILGVLFGLVGLIGTFYTVQARINKKKEDSTYKYLFDLAEKNIDKTVTEDILRQKKDEVKKQSDKIIELQSKIEKEIPRQARMAVLRDKFYTISETLSENFRSLKKIENELNEVNLDETIPKEILAEIENEIAPSYLLKERRSNTKNYITIITTAVAIISALLPRPFDRWLTFPLLLIAVPFIYQLLKTYLPDDRNKRKYTYAKIFRIVFFAIGGFGLIISLALFIIWLFEPSEIDLLSTQIILGISFLLSLLGFIYHMKFKKLKILLNNS